jgi:hypothetical protein
MGGLTMKITYKEKNVKKEVKAILKKINPYQVKFEMKLFNEYPGITFTGYKHDNTKIEVTKKIDIEWASSEYRIIDLTEFNSVLLDMILSDTFHLEIYPKNLDKISINNNETEYFMDTIVIKNVKSKLELSHNNVGFERVRMINKV